MGSLGFGELIALAVLALFIFGPDRLPGVARTVGKTVAQVRREATKTLGELKDAAGLDEDVAELAREARELRSTITGAKRTAANAIMNPVGAAKDEIKGLSAGGPAAAAMTAAGLVPGDAPFDPDAT